MIQNQKGLLSELPVSSSGGSANIPVTQTVAPIAILQLNQIVSPSSSIEGTRVFQKSNDEKTAKICQLVGQYLSGPLPFLERRKTRNEIALGAINDLFDSKFRSDWNVFAMTQCLDSIVRTPHEGGFLEDSIQESIHYLSFCIKENRFFLSIPSTQLELYRKLHRSLELMLKYRKFQLPYSDHPTEDQTVIRMAQKWLASIEKDLDEHSEIYLPFSYRSGPQNQSHAISIKVSYKDQARTKIHIQQLNIGNGAQSNPICEYTLYGKKISFVTFPRSIDKSKFFGSKGLAALCKLLRYSADLPVGSPYDGDDINDILNELFFGEDGSEFSLGPLESEFGVKPQIAKTCSVEVTKNVIRDLLITSGLSKVERDRFDLNKNLYSLINHFLAYRQEPGNSKYLNFLETSAKTLARAVEELYESRSITSEELIKTVSVLRKITKRDNTFFSLVYSGNSCSSIYLDSSSPEITQLGKATLPITSFDQSNIEIEHASPFDSQQKNVSNIAFEIPIFEDIHQLPKTLARWIGIASSMDSEEAFNYVDDCFKQIPIPLREDAEGINVWKELDKKEIPHLLENIQKIIQIAICKNNEVVFANLHKALMIILTGSAITDFLARSLPETKLKGYITSFLPFGWNFSIKGFTSLNFALDNHRFTQLKNYNYGRNPGEKIAGLVIFPTESIIDIEKIFNDRLAGIYEEETLVGVLHMNYLSLFLNKNATLKDFKDNWYHGLPRPAQILYYLNYLYYFLLIGLERVELPEELKFIEIRNLENKLVPAPFLNIDPLHISPLYSGFGVPLYMRKKSKMPIFLSVFTRLSFPDRSIEFITRDLSYRKSNKKGDHRSSIDEKEDVFLNIFSREIRNLSENEIACYKSPEEIPLKFSGAQVRMLLSVIKFENLRFWKIIQEFSLPENYSLLHHEGVQEIFDFCIFQPIYLIKELKKTPDAERSFRNLIKDILTRLSQGQFYLKTTLFLLKEGIAFEGFTNQGRERDLALSFYEEMLVRLQKQEISKDYEVKNLKLLFIFLRNIQKKLSDPTELLDLVGILFHFHLEPKKNENKSWLMLSMMDISRTFIYRNCESIDNYKNKICTYILENLLLAELLSFSVNQEWVGHFPKYSNQDGYVINFLEGTLYSTKNRGFIKRIDHSYINNEHALENLKNSLCWIFHDGSKISLNKRWVFLPNDDQWSEIALESAAKEHFALLLASERRSSTPNKCIDNFYNWAVEKQLKIDSLENGNVIIHKDGIPFLKIDRINSRYERLNANGVALPYESVDLSGVRYSDLLYSYTNRFINPQYLLCFLDRRSNKIAELIFFKLNLTFIADMKGLQAVQIPGMYLIATEADLQSFSNPLAGRIWQEISAHLGEYKQAFILYNPERERWMVLFPEYSISISNHKSPIGTLESSEKVYHFDYDPITMSFKAAVHEKDGAAYVYLAYLYKVLGDPEKAIEYINRVNPIKRKIDISWIASFHKFTLIKDFSIPSIAFNLKLALLLFRVRNTMTEDLFRKNNGRVIFNSYTQWSMDLYENFFDERKFKDLPEKLQISRSDQRILLFNFRDNYFYISRTPLDWERDWSKNCPILDAQFTLFNSKRGEVKIKPPVQKVPLSPPIYFYFCDPNQLIFRYSANWVETFFKKRGSLPIPKYAVRVQKDTTLSNFPQLYDMAVDSSRHHLFDEIIHALLKESDPIKSNNETYAPASLLVYVRHFSHLFKQLMPSKVDWNSKEECSRWFNSLFDCFKKLIHSHSEELEVFSEKYLKNNHLHFVKEKTILAEKQIKRFEKYSQRESTLKSKDLMDFSIYELQKNLEEIEENIHKTFNGHYKQNNLDQTKVVDEALFLLRKIGSRLSSVSKNHYYNKKELPKLIMKEVVLGQDFSFFISNRNFLSKNQMEDICRWVCDWYFILTILTLKKEKKEHLFIDYDHQNFPEFSYFYINEGKFPRKRQMRIYQKLLFSILNGRNHHFQLRAGDGKTDVMTVLLYLLASRCGLMAVTLMTPAMYNENINRLSDNLSLMGKRIGLLELKLSKIHEYSGYYLEFIYREVMQYKYMDIGLGNTRESYATIFLILHLACVMSISARKSPEKDTLEFALERGKKIRWTFHLLNFFEEKVLLLWDESHQSKNPKNRFIYGVGDFNPLPTHESSHLFDLMYFYREEFDDTSSQIAVAKDYQKFREMSISLEDFRETLANSYLNFFSEIQSLNEKREFLNYWLRKSPKPAKLIQWANSKNIEEKELADKIALTLYFLSDGFLTDILTLRTDVDHARSPYPYRRHEVPAQNKIVSSAEYEDRYKGDALTIKGYFDRGLDFKDFCYLLKTLESKHLKEFKKERITPSQKTFKSWVQYTLYESLELGTISQLSDRLVKDLYKILKKNKKVLAYFVKNISMKESGYPDTQLVCTINDFKAARHISFTATPNPELTFPNYYRRGPYGDFSKDIYFEKNVTDTFLQSKNGTTICLKDDLDFFEKMSTSYKNIFDKVTVLLDPRGFFQGLTNLEIAKRWLRFNPELDGIIFCDENKSEESDKSESESIKTKEATEVENEQVRLLFKGTVHHINNGDIKGYLKDLGYDWNFLRLGTYYDPPRTESWHVDQKDDAIAFVLVCEGISRYHLIQMLMRLRKFTDPNSGQRIVQVYREISRKKIFKDKTPTAQLLIDYASEISKQMDEKNIILKAFENIRNIISAPAYAELKRAFASDRSEDMREVVDVFERYERGLTDKVSFNAYLMHSSPDELQDTRIVLQRYAEQTYAKFRYTTPYQSNFKVQTEVNNEITSVEKKIPKIHTKDNDTITRSVEHHMELKIQLEKEQENFIARNKKLIPLEAEKDINREYAINSPLFLNLLQEKRTNQLSPFLSSELIILNSFLRTAKMDDRNTTEDFFIRSIDFLWILIYKDNKEEKIIGLIDNNLNTSLDLEIIEKCPAIVENLNHQAFLVNNLGLVVARGSGALKPEEQVVQNFLTSKVHQYLQMDIALLNGRIPNIDELFKRIEEFHTKTFSTTGKSGWIVFEEFWMDMKERVIETSNIQSYDFEVLKRRWYQKYPSTPSLTFKSKDIDEKKSDDKQKIDRKSLEGPKDAANLWKLYENFQKKLKS